MFFPAPHGTFSNDYILGNKTNLNRYKTWNNYMYLIRSPWLKIRIQSNTNFRKLIHTWKLNNANLNHQWVKEEIKDKMKNFLKFNKNDHTTYPNLWDTKESLLREKFVALSAYINCRPIFLYDMAARF